VTKLAGSQPWPDGARCITPLRARGARLSTSSEAAAIVPRVERASTAVMRALAFALSLIAAPDADAGAETGPRLS
jgi:hypothetical protein